LINFLDWDSKFFGLTIGEVKSKTNRISTQFYSNLTSYDLVYIFTKKKLETIDWFPQFLFSSITVNYSMDVRANFKNEISCESIWEYTGTDYSKLYPLAISAGVFSRFRMDPNFLIENHRKLYCKWIEESNTGIMGDIIFGYFHNSEITGLVTMSLDFERKQGRIGLLSVDSSKRGKGIGKALIKKCHDYLLINGMHKLFVSTQEENVAANKLYRKFGFTKQESTHVTHIWNLV